MGFEKYKKWTKVNTCFSFNKPTKQDIFHFLATLVALRLAKSVKNSTSAFSPQKLAQKRVNPSAFKFATKQRN